MMLALLQELVPTTLAGNADLCMLCAEGLDELEYPMAVVESTGATCSTKALDLAVTYQPGSEECMAQVNQWRPICCNAPPPDTVAIAQVERPQEPKIGPYPPCGVCYTGDYPGVTSMVLTVLYIGSGSCAQFEKVSFVIGLFFLQCLNLLEGQDSYT
jgi:hypothetical protein